MLNYIDSWLDRITMYRLLLYYLIALVAIAMGLSQLGYLNYNPLVIGFSAIILTVTCLVTNKLFAGVFNAPANVESCYITALILTLIISPARSGQDIAFLLAAGGLAMASKYILTIRQKHIFNPAAIAVVLTAIGPKQSAIWWVGTAVMLPYVVIGGILLGRKIRRLQMITTFLVTSLVATTVYSLLRHANVMNNLHGTILSSGLFFLAFVMLTEPLTSPPTARKQKVYAVLAGALFPPQVRFLNVYSTPELVLAVSNVFSYLISPKTKLFPVLKRKVRLAPDTMDFIFAPRRKFAYQAGQYMEWTLPHPHTDSRGNRRIFTIASSPTEQDLHLGVKFYQKGSSFKKTLLAMDDRTPVTATQIAGDFVLPKNPGQKLAFIAGGIGITPYRSMVKYLLDTDQKRDITLLYSARNVAELAYKDVFETARQQLGIKVVYTLTDPSQPKPDQHSRLSYINAELIKQEIPDYPDRLFYISGTHAMVTAMRKILAGLGVKRHNIKTDFFSGYA